MECQNSSSHGSTATHQPLRYVARMGRYRDHIVPRLVELSCGAKGIDRWRVSAMDGLAGRVIEIGFGSGLNVPHYPEAVTEVLAVEPAATARKIAEARIGASRIPIVHVGLDGQAVALPDASCEAALCTFSLCTAACTCSSMGVLLTRASRPGSGASIRSSVASPTAAT